MKVIFLDFDGVLNSEGSFLYESRRRKEWKEQNLKGKVNETLCNVCASNLQMILDNYPEVKIVVSSTWREFYDIPWLQSKLNEYHVDFNRVIGAIPLDKVSMNRGKEIAEWLSFRPEVTQYIIIDDNDWGITEYHDEKTIVKTEWESGLTFTKAKEAINKLSTKNK